MIVLNKIDQVDDPDLLANLRDKFPGAMEVSALKGIGIDELRLKFCDQLSDRVKKLTYRIPQSRGDISGLLHRKGKVLETDYEGNDIIMKAVVPKDFEEQLAEFLVTE